MALNDSNSRAARIKLEGAARDADADGDAAMQPVMEHDARTAVGSSDAAAASSASAAVAASSSAAAAASSARPSRSAKSAALSSIKVQAKREPAVDRAMEDDEDAGAFNRAARRKRSKAEAEAAESKEDAGEESTKEGEADEGKETASPSKARSRSRQPKRQRVKQEAASDSSASDNDSAAEEEDGDTEPKVAGRSRRTPRRRKQNGGASNFVPLEENNYRLCHQFYDEDELNQLCGCTRPTVAGEMTCTDDSCINAMMKVECRPECDMKERCGNQRFKKRQYANVVVKPAGGKDHGLFAASAIRAGQFIIEYVGEVLSEENCQKRIEKYKNSSHFYLLTLSSLCTIDATRKGNSSRFINHSCAPNAATQKWHVSGLPRVGLFALEDIPAGSEITFDYQYERYGGKKQKCLCGAPNCAGFLGGKPQRPAESKEEGGDAAHSTDGDDDLETDKDAPLLDPVAHSVRQMLRCCPPMPPPASTAAPAGAASARSHARPWESFPRALRRASTMRTVQLFTLLRLAQERLLPQHAFSAGDALAPTVLSDRTLPFLKQLSAGNLPELMTSKFFQPQPASLNR